MYLAAEQFGVLRHAVGNVGREFTHAERLHAGLHARISPLPVSEKSPL
jgi:hypothetical protein